MNKKIKNVIDVILLIFIFICICMYIIKSLKKRKINKRIK